jgi:hypothetical protein
MEKKSENVCQTIDDFYESLKRSKKYYFSIESRKKKGFLGLTTTNEYTVLTEKDGMTNVTCNSGYVEIKNLSDRKLKTAKWIQNISPADHENGVYQIKEFWTGSTKTLVLPFPKEFSIFRPYNPTNRNIKCSPFHTHTSYPSPIHSNYLYSLYTLSTSSYSH